MLFVVIDINILAHSHMHTPSRKAAYKIKMSFSLLSSQTFTENWESKAPSVGTLLPPIYLHWDFRNFWHSPVWNIQFEFFPSLNWEKIPVWNIKLAKSKIPVRVVKNVISKWTKMEFPRFPFLWFTAVGVVNPPDQKLVMYISVNCKKGINS